MAPILDATPARRAPRLLGKYLGAAAATAIPILVVYCGLAVAYAVTPARRRALRLGAGHLRLVIVPGLLFVAAFALTVPLIMPAPLFRVLFVGYWLWGNVVAPDMMPTLARTLVHPIGGYPLNALLDFHGYDGDRHLSGPVPGATLNFLRPEPTAVDRLAVHRACCSALAPPRSPAASALRARRASMTPPERRDDGRGTRCGSRSPA